MPPSRTTLMPSMVASLAAPGKPAETKVTWWPACARYRAFSHMVMSPPVVAGWYQSRVARNRTLRLANLDRLPRRSFGGRCFALRAVGEDVPDHHEPDFEPGPERAARALGLADASPQRDRDLDQRQPSVQSNQEHVWREVVTPDNQVGEDPLERVLADRPVGAADI